MAAAMATQTAVAVATAEAVAAAEEATEVVVTAAVPEVTGCPTLVPVCSNKTGVK